VALPAATPKASLSLGQALLAAGGFPQQMFHIPGISNFLQAPLHLKFHSHSFCSLPSQELFPGILMLPYIAWFLRPSFEDFTTLAFYMPAKPVWCECL
jgi:hypothetical protein